MQLSFATFIFNLLLLNHARSRVELDCRLIAILCKNETIARRNVFLIVRKFHQLPVQWFQSLLDNQQIPTFETIHLFLAAGLSYSGEENEVGKTFGVTSSWLRLISGSWNFRSPSGNIFTLFVTWLSLLSSVSRLTSTESTISWQCRNHAFHIGTYSPQSISRTSQSIDDSKDQKFIYKNEIETKKCIYKNVTYDSSDSRFIFNLTQAKVLWIVYWLWFNRTTKMKWSKWLIHSRKTVYF